MRDPPVHSGFLGPLPRSPRTDTAGASGVPPALLAQLGEGGRLVIPVGESAQHLEVPRRTAERIEVTPIFPSLRKAGGLLGGDRRESPF